MTPVIVLMRVLCQSTPATVRSFVNSARPMPHALPCVSSVKPRIIIRLQATTSRSVAAWSLNFRPTTQASIPEPLMFFQSDPQSTDRSSGTAVGAATGGQSPAVPSLVRKSSQEAPLRSCRSRHTNSRQSPGHQSRHIFQYRRCHRLDDFFKL